jgi:hypothetical protein
MSAGDFSMESILAQAIANTMGDILRRHYGRQQYYSGKSVAAACSQCKVPESRWEYAVAMFARPDESEHLLRQLGSPRTALEIRRALASQIFLHHLPDVSYEAPTNCFHEAANFNIDPGRPAAGRRKHRNSCGYQGCASASCGGHSSGGHSCGGHGCGGGH